MIVFKFKFFFKLVIKPVLAKIKFIKEDNLKIKFLFMITHRRKKNKTSLSSFSFFLFRFDLIKDRLFVRLFNYIFQRKNKQNKEEVY